MIDTTLTEHVCARPRHTNIGTLNLPNIISSMVFDKAMTTIFFFKNIRLQLLQSMNITKFSWTCTKRGRLGFLLFVAREAASTISEVSWTCTQRGCTYPFFLRSLSSVLHFCLDPMTCDATAAATTYTAVRNGHGGKITPHRFKFFFPLRKKGAKYTSWRQKFSRPRIRAGEMDVYVHTRVDMLCTYVSELVN